jgi:hypothetical protein
VFHIGVTGMNVAPCRYYKPNNKPELPDAGKKKESEVQK